MVKHSSRLEMGPQRDGATNRLGTCGGTAMGTARHKDEDAGPGQYQMSLFFMMTLL